MTTPIHPGAGASPYGLPLGEPPRSDRARATSPEAPAGSPASVSVTLSEQAQGALATGPKPVSSTAQDARAKLDGDYAKALSQGSRIVSDIANGGRLLDVSSLTDQELAAVRLNKDGLFTKNEGTTAAAELGQRVQRSLEPFEDDLRAYQTGVQQLYQVMPQEVRDALEWSPSMIEMSRTLVAGSEARLGALDRESFLQAFIEHLEAQREAADRRTLDVDTRRFSFDDARRPPLASDPATLPIGQIVDLAL